MLEPLNFADDIVRSSYGGKRAVFKDWKDACFVNLDKVAELGPYFFVDWKP